MDPEYVRTVAHNFIDSYGLTQMQKLLEEFKDPSISNVDISKDLGVSHERVRQWRNIFGETIRDYKVSPLVQKVIDKRLIRKARMRP